MVAPNEKLLVGPIIKAKFDRVSIGMTLKEVEAIMGPAGPSYSSQIEREYYIWKDHGAWISVFVEQDRVTVKDIRPAP